MKVDGGNPGQINKNKHELRGSLGVFKLLTSQLLKETDIDERTLRVLEMMVSLLERSLDLNNSKHDHLSDKVTYTL